MSLCRKPGIRAGLTREAKEYQRNWRDDRVPYKSWKQYRGYQTRKKVSNDSILNHIPLEEIMSKVTYTFTCAADVTRRHQISVHESLDMSEYIEAMTRTGFRVESSTGQVWKPSKEVLLIEPKNMPDTFMCERCVDIMEFVSIDLGYSCNNPGCDLHMSVDRIASRVQGVGSL